MPSVLVVDVDLFLHEAATLRTPSVIEPGRATVLSEYAAAVLQTKLHARSPVARSTSLYMSNLLSRYILIKLLNCAVFAIQLVFTRNLLDEENFLFGRSVLLDLMQGRQWTRNFPRVAHCEYKVSSTITCILRIE